jgi:dipeptidyl aminopeptidase/acylaminoacyl peptidase
VRVPTLIIHGTKDDTVTIEHARRFAAGRANVELIELDDGHELIASLPRILAETDRFLGYSPAGI